jgi:hypothetical protein
MMGDAVGEDRVEVRTDYHGWGIGCAFEERRDIAYLVDHWAESARPERRDDGFGTAALPACWRGNLGERHLEADGGFVAFVQLPAGGGQGCMDRSDSVGCSVHGCNCADRRSQGKRAADRRRILFPP